VTLGGHGKRVADVARSIDTHVRSYVEALEDARIAPREDRLAAAHDVLAEAKRLRSLAADMRHAALELERHAEELVEGAVRTIGREAKS
jgi:hypothetical protein